MARVRNVILQTVESCSCFPQGAGTNDVVWVCPHITRRFGDPGSFRIIFDDEGKKDTRVQFPIEEPEWIMGGSHCGGGCGQMSNTTVVPWAPIF